MIGMEMIFRGIIMSRFNKLLKVQLPLFAGAMLTTGAAVAGLSYSFGIAVVSANYEINAPHYQPDLLSSSPVTIQHKLYAVDFDPNEVRVQRRIRQGWYSDADPVKHCINVDGTRDNSCAWKDWNVEWEFERYAGSADAISVYTRDVSIAGNAYASWPLFPADEAAYQENPNFVYYAPKTSFLIETRYEHPTVGWLYDVESFEVYCDGQRAWKHYPTGQTTCEGL